MAENIYDKENGGTEVYQPVQVLIVPSLYGSPSRRLGFCL